MITLLEKKDKDKKKSLIDVDVKIASQGLAKRLEPILPSLIPHSQSAFIKGRSIFDAIRTIDDTLEYAKRNNRPGILEAIDFEKAFDSNFSLKFCRIKTLYSNLLSCVLNNGFTTNRFCNTFQYQLGYSKVKEIQLEFANC